MLNLNNLSTLNYISRKPGGDAPAPDPILNTYPGANAAYSTRKLDKNYAGSAISVRRSSDNGEQDIGFDSGGDLDEVALTSFVGANDGFVTTWYDQSGNGYDAIQGTAASQPKIVSAGTVVKENGEPALRFTGPEGFVLNMGSSYSQYAIFNVLTFNRTDVVQIPFRDFASAPSTALHAFSTFNDSFYRLSGNESGLSTDIATEFGTSQSLFYMGDLGSTGEVYVDGILRIDGFGTVGSIDNKIALGENGSLGDNGLQGTMQEFILYPSDQSANRTGIEGNINSYYSIY